MVLPENISSHARPHDSEDAVLDGCLRKAQEGIQRLHKNERINQGVEHE